MSQVSEQSQGKKRLMVVFGTRPEAIKMAPVIKELRRSNLIDTRVCITGQHREMLDQVLEIFNIVPDYDLSLMHPGQTLTELTNKVISEMEKVFLDWRPDLILVHGDTTTAFASSLAAFYQQIPIGHVEAGLRSGNIYSPWPEEINRSLVGSMAALHFAPTIGAAENLLSENVSDENIIITGNTVIDALLETKERIDSDAKLRKELDKKFSFIERNKKIILITAHRRENFGKGFEDICNAILAISEREDVQIIYPVHLNPNVKEIVFEMLGNKSNINLIEPQEYLPFVYLLMSSHIILTDSGGIQEEAPSLGRPVLVLRENTERPEALEAGTVVLVGTNPKTIVKETNKLLDDKYHYNNIAATANPFGDGSASKKIIEALLKEGEN